MTKLYPKLPAIFLWVISFLGAHSLLAQPTISSFSPLSGPVGSTITITGTNFSTVPANNIVYFGTGFATVTAATSTALTVTVPTGASYQPITVTTGNLTAYSALPFIVTFPGGSSAFTSQTFSASKRTGVPASNFGDCVADVNEDGKPDVFAFGTQDLYINSATTTNFYFGSQYYLNYPLSNIASVTMADLDGDGKPDLVTNGGGLNVFHNTSTTAVAFTYANEYQATPADMTTRDMDGDGKPDLITANADSTLTLYRNTTASGAISFSNANHYTIDSYTDNFKTIATADLDGDGKPDVIVTSAAAGKLYIFKNTSSAGNITLGTAISYTTSDSLGWGPNKIAVVDLDGDGKLDLAIANAREKNLVLYQNTSTPGSISFSKVASFYCGPWNTTGVAAGDIDGDGKPDLAVSTTDLPTLNFSNTYPILAFRNTSTPGSFSLASPVSYPVGYSSYTVTIADMNGDGKPDLVTSDPANRTINVLINQAQPPSAPHLSFFTPSSGKTGDTIRVHGTALATITAVSFGSIAAQSFNIASDTLITAIVGTGASGSVLVNGPGGTDSLNGFTYIPPAPPPAPHIYRFSPDSGRANDTIFIYGSSLRTITSVSFGDVPARSFDILSDTLIQAMVGTGASGSVLVSGPGGTDSLNGFIFKKDTTASSDTNTTSPPVQPDFHLTAFYATLVAGQPVLQWKSMFEKNIGYYVLEHGADSAGLTAISSVKAYDTDSASYSFADPAPRNGLNYYQLKITDSAGNTILYSGIVTIEASGVSPTLGGYPNPAKGIVSVALPQTTSPSQFTLVNMNGKVLQKIPVDKNVQQVNINVAGLMPGVYKLIWSDGTNSSYQSILILK